MTTVTHPVTKAIASTVIFSVLTLLLLSVVTFSTIEILPGGFAEAILGQFATPDTIEAFNRELGLDRPSTVRYFEWLTGIVQGDFGYSYAGYDGSIKRSVSSVILPRFYNTLFLAVETAAAAVPVSLFLGFTTAIYRNSWYDRIVNGVMLVSIATPEFFIAYLVLYFFAVKLRWFYSLSMISGDTSFLEQIYRCALPSLTLTLVLSAYIMRQTRAAIMQILSEPYIEMAELKGASKKVLVLRHALPNAWGPIAIIIAFSFAYLMVGVVVVENVFDYPGIGQLMVDAVATRDMPVVQACSMVFSATYIFFNLCADVVAIITNPRLMRSD